MNKLLLALTLTITSVLVTQAEVKQMGKIKLKENIIVKVEAGAGVTVDETGSKISTTYTGIIGTNYVINSSFVNDDTVKVLETAGDKFLHIYGQEYHSYQIINTRSDISQVWFHMPGGADSKHTWVVEFIDQTNEAGRSFNVQYNDGNFYEESRHEFKGSVSGDTTHVIVFESAGFSNWLLKSFRLNAN